jgi:hypothetical protein
LREESESSAGKSEAWEEREGPVSKGTGRSEAWGGSREGESFAGGSKAWEGGIIIGI